MSNEDRIAHCRTRIAQEDRAAERAATDAARRAHGQLAGLYRRLEGVLVRSVGQPLQLPDATFLALHDGALHDAHRADETAASHRQY